MTSLAHTGYLPIAHILEWDSYHKLLNLYDSCKHFRLLCSSSQHLLTIMRTLLLKQLELISYFLYNIIVFSIERGFGVLGFWGFGFRFRV